VYTYEEYKKLEAENEYLKAKLQRYRDGMTRFLNEEQIQEVVHGYQLF